MKEVKLVLSLANVEKTRNSKTKISDSLRLKGNVYFMDELKGGMLVMAGDRRQKDGTVR